MLLNILSYFLILFISSYFSVCVSADNFDSNVVYSHLTKGLLNNQMEKMIQILSSCESVFKREKNNS